MTIEGTLRGNAQALDTWAGLDPEARATLARWHAATAPGKAELLRALKAEALGPAPGDHAPTPPERRTVVAPPATADTHATPDRPRPPRLAQRGEAGGARAQEGR